MGFHSLVTPNHFFTVFTCRKRSLNWSEPVFNYPVNKTMPLTFQNIVQTNHSCNHARPNRECLDSVKRCLILAGWPFHFTMWCQVSRFKTKQQQLSFLSKYNSAFTFRGEKIGGEFAIQSECLSSMHASEYRSHCSLSWANVNDGFRIFFQSRRKSSLNPL